MSLLGSLLGRLRPPPTSGTLDLALSAERSARILSGLSLSDAVDDSQATSIDQILHTTCVLLDRLVIRSATTNNDLDQDGPSPVDAPPTSSEVEAPPTETGEMAATPPTAEPPASVGGAAIKTEGPADTLEIVQDLISLRDMLGSVQSEEVAPGGGLIAIDRKLLKALGRAGVQLLDLTGPFDYHLQEIIDVRMTTYPAEEEMVCETVRPGYKLGDRVLRPQQVVVYRMAPPV